MQSHTNITNLPIPDQSIRAGCPVEVIHDALTGGQVAA